MCGGGDGEARKGGRRTLRRLSVEGKRGLIVIKPSLWHSLYEKYVMTPVFWMRKRKLRGIRSLPYDPTASVMGRSWNFESGNVFWSPCSHLLRREEMGASSV